MNWFLPLVLAFSYSVRTPNVGNELDYLYFFSSEKKDVAYAHVEKEREQGKHYTNEEYWTQYKYKNFLIKDRYVNKTSREINYNQLELAGTWKGFKSGYALRHVDEIPSHRFIAGWGQDMALTGVIRVATQLGLSTDFGQIDYNAYTKFDFAVMKFLNIFSTAIYEKSGSQEYWHMKTGISVEIPQLGG